LRGKILVPVADLGAADPNANIETVCGLLSNGRGKLSSQGREQYDLIVARHILEHSGNCRQFLHTLWEMLAPEGLLVIEAPDCAGNLVRMDYTMIWEEHSLYFSRENVAQAVQHAGFRLLDLESYPYRYEDVLVLYARKPTSEALPSRTIDQNGLTQSLERARTFGASFPAMSRSYHELFRRLTAGNGKLAAYGAGHLTCAFLNLHEVARYFTFVVDDTPEKQGLFLPKTGLPIVSSDRLVADGITTCLFGFNPQTEARVIAKSQAFVAQGGRFFSLLADSDIAVRQLL
jgi:hypothetical protein